MYSPSCERVEAMMRIHLRGGDVHIAHLVHQGDVASSLEVTPRVLSLLKGCDYVQTQSAEREGREAEMGGGGGGVSTLSRAQ
jgi:hypothetical protein